MEVRGEQIILNVYAGQRKIATRTLGTVSAMTGAGGGGLIDRGIKPTLGPTHLVPVVLFLIVILILGSLRPAPIIRPQWALQARGPPVLAIKQAAVIARRALGPTWRSHGITYIREITSLLTLRAMTQYLVRKIATAWYNYRRTLQDTIFYFPQRAVVKAFLVFITLLAVIQPPALLLAGDTGEPPLSASDTEYFIYHHDDHLGSSHVLTEGNETARHSGVTYHRGEILQRYEYRPFGQETFVLNPILKFDPSYTGQTYDVETGLYYYKSRYYNPELGRFIQGDTVVPDAKNLQAYNRYSYVANNPLKFVDPSGHFWGLFKKIFGAFFGALVSVLTGFALAPLSLGIWASVIAGAAGGIIGGAISGGLKGALWGGLFGALGGLAFGGANIGLEKLGLSNQWHRFAVLAGVSAPISYATDGLQGLMTFGASLAGALSGKLIGAATGLEAWAKERSAIGGPTQNESDEVGRIIEKSMQADIDRAFSGAHSTKSSSIKYSLNYSGKVDMANALNINTAETVNYGGKLVHGPTVDVQIATGGAGLTAMANGALLIKTGLEFMIMNPTLIGVIAGGTLTIVGIGSLYVGYQLSSEAFQLSGTHKIFAR
jgi:RHS repeat-associated protein